MLGVIGLLLFIWLVVVALGIAVKGLFWLAIIGAVLFVVTGIGGWMRRS